MNTNVCFQCVAYWCALYRFFNAEVSVSEEVGHDAVLHNHHAHF